jgi:hypothetical protein
MNAVKVRLLNNGCYDGLEDVTFPVEVDAYDIEDSAVKVPYKELLRIGGSKEYFSGYGDETTLPFHLLTECEIISQDNTTKAPHIAQNTPIKTPIVWNGESPLEVGMLVTQGEIKLLGVNGDKDEVAVVEKDGCINMYWLDALAHIKTEEELMRDKVVDFVNKNRNTTTGTIVEMLIKGGFRV